MFGFIHLRLGCGEFAVEKPERGKVVFVGIGKRDFITAFWLSCCVSGTVAGISVHPTKA
jgi:hypothetical protein